MCCAMESRPSRAFVLNKKRWDEGIGHQEREIFEMFLALPAPQRKIAREVIEALAIAFPAKAQKKA